jgi:hypothetical protein
MLFVAACSGGVTPRPAIETVPIREGIDTTSPDGGETSAASSDVEQPADPPKKSPSKSSPKKKPSANKKK